MSYGFGRINDLVHKAHQTAKVKGFHDDKPAELPLDIFSDYPRYVVSLLALVGTEVSEAVEAVRNRDLDNFEEELADIVIRVFDLAGMMDVNLEQRIVNKMTKNTERELMHGDKAL